MKIDSKKKIILLVKRNLRFLIQLLFFILAPGLFSAAFGGVKTASSLIGRGEVLEITSAILTLLVLLAFTWIFGRVFCGMVCSFGAFGDLVFTIGELVRKKLKLKKVTIPKKTEKLLSYLKYVVLVAILAICFFQGQKFIHGKSPWDAFAQLISGSPRFKRYEIGYLILFLIMIGMVLIPRFFCRFLCPLGAIFALLPPPLLSLKKFSSAPSTHRACGRCQACSSACPAGLELNKEDNPMDVVTSGECFRCMKCALVCPQKKPALYLAGKRLPLIPMVATILVLFIALLIVFGLTRF
ncbi:MAG: 4Fe-4S binding protein [Sphaerochaetaceae bacterium]|nr:4Fe-4S binding protein [Sphaerochaetaceae bacterium]